MIATVTLNPAVDQTVQLSHPLVADEVTRVDDARFDPGGKGINVSKYLAAMGVETVATGVLGGFLGDYVTDTLAELGIETAFVGVDGQTRLNTTVLATDGEYKLNQNGPEVDASIIETVLERLVELDPETVLVGGSLPPGLTAGAIDRIARGGPWETVVDVDGPLLKALKADYALCKPNETELEAATDQSVTTVPEAKRAAATLRAQGFDRVVASLGSDGAVLATADGVVHEPAQPADIVDTVGAGDSLLSGVLAAMATGADAQTALRTGIQVATAVVAVPGTTVPSLPALAEIDDGPVAEQN